MDCLVQTKEQEYFTIHANFTTFATKKFSVQTKPFRHGQFSEQGSVSLGELAAHVPEYMYPYKL